MKKITYPLLLAAILIACFVSSRLRAEDTYNFYFQKAPGPMVVNQGAAGPTNPADIVVKQNVANVEAPPPATSNAATPAPAPETLADGGPQRWELSAGISGLSQGISIDAHQNIHEGVQYSAGLMLHLNENFGLLAESFYLKNPPTMKFQGSDRAVKGSRFDYSIGLVITPVHLRASSRVMLAVSGIGGVASAPFIGAKELPSGNIDPASAELKHAGSAFYGARASLEYGRAVAAQAEFKRLDRFAATQGTASVALLF